MTASRPLTLLRGLAALATLSFLLVGIPLWLNAVAGSPIPAALPSGDMIWSTLTSRDDGTLLLTLLKYAAWAGWVLFLVSVVADVVTRLRGLPAPRLGPQQQLATQLVGAVAALAVILPTQGAAMAAPASAPPAAVTTTSAGVAAPSGWLASLTGQVEAANYPSPTDQGYAEYTVRGGDCLWDIAWNELGEPELWPEIYDASRAVAQPDGHRLTDPDFILPGWVLHIPAPDEADVPAHRRLAEPTPRTRRDGSAESGDASDPDAVVTPLRGRPAPSDWHGALEAHPADREQVATPLRTPNSNANAPASAVEAHWLQSMLAGGQDRHNDQGWRERLLPDS